MSRNEKFLIFVMRIVGGVMLLAWLAVFLPNEWMAAGHRMMQLGEFPAAPLTEYLTRTISALYGIHGGLLVVLATDIHRYAKIIRYIASMNLIFGVVVTVVDLRAGLPWFWTWSEGPPIIGVAVLMLWLLSSVERESPA